MENEHKKREIKDGQRAMIFLCLVVSGISSSVLSTAMTTALPGVVEYFGSFLTLSACIYAPLAALLFADFFVVRRQHLALRSAFGLPGYQAYHYTGDFNLIGLACVAAGVALSLAVYDPVSGTVRCAALFTLTPTGLSFLGTGVLYVVLSWLPPVRRYLLQDRKEVTV